MAGDPWDNDPVVGATPAPAAQTQEAYASATPQQQQFLAANGATYDRSRVPGVTFDTPTQTGGDDISHVTPQGVLVPATGASGGQFWNDDPITTRRHDDILGFEQMALKPLDNAASWLEGGLGKLGVPVDAIDKAFGLPSANAVKQAHLDYIRKQAAVGVDPGIAGQIAGGVLGTLPLAALPGGALAQGAMGGAALSDAKDLKGVATDAAIGAVGGKLGDLALGGVRNVISPQIAAAQRYLLDRGVRLTPGQIAGGGAKRLEDTLTSVPVVGDLVKSARARSVDDFNRAAVNETLAPIGKALPASVDTGHEAVAHATKTLGDAYDGVLSKITNVQPDPAFYQGMGAIGQDVSSGILPEAQLNQFKTIIKQRMLDRLDSSPTGETMKLVDSDLGQLGQRYSKSSDVAQQQLGDAITSAQGELRSLIERNNPQYAQNLRGINRGWAQLVRVQKAAGSSASTTGVFSPTQFNSAVTGSASKSQASQGDALMQDLSKAGKEVLPSTVPDSGTAGRSAMMLLGGAALGGHAAHISPEAMLAAAAIAGPYLGMGQSAVRAAMTNRPAAAKAVADYLSHLKGPAVAAGAAGAVAAHDAWTQP